MLEIPNVSQDDYTIIDVIKIHQLEAMQQITVTFNQNPVQLSKPILSFTREGKKYH